MHQNNRNKLTDNNKLFTVSNLSEDSYDYVFGGRRETPPVTSSIKLTSPPIRIRTDGKSSSLTKNKIQKTHPTEHTATLIGEATSSTSHIQHSSHSYCKSVLKFPPRTPPRTTSVSGSTTVTAASTVELLNNTSNKLANGEADEATLRQLLLEYVYKSTLVLHLFLSLPPCRRPSSYIYSLLFYFFFVLLNSLFQFPFFVSEQRKSERNSQVWSLLICGLSGEL